MKKGGFLRNVLDTIRSNQNDQRSGGSSDRSGSAQLGREFGGQLKAQQLALSQVARHGFPEQPSALAFDPVQKIAAIGTKTGVLRVFGRPGVDVWAQHKPEYAITHIRFIINQGAIITVTSDESIHLWSLRGPNLKLQLSASSNTAGSPAPQSQLPESSSSSSSSAASHQQHHHHHSTLSQHPNPVDSAGAQPGDPDYLLSGDLSGASPTSGLPSGQTSGEFASSASAKQSRKPEILHTLKFQREHITYLHQTLNSKWLYIGTERGNVHVANVETFELSGYSIAWNKAVELSRKTHPGSIIHISECPQDSNKLLIGYESGCIVLWDLRGKTAEGRYYNTENLLWLSWHYEGKQFVAAHGDGSLVTWQIRSNARPTQVLHPHAKAGGSGGEHPDTMAQALPSGQQSMLTSSFARAFNNELYRPINKVEWKTSKANEQFLLFSGGLPYDGLEQQSSGNISPSLRQPQLQQQQQYLKAASASPSLASPSPLSPSVSPGLQSVSADPSKPPSRQSQSGAHSQMQHRKSLRSTSLTVMYGKSITVLEMDETIVDFITVCDNSPHENDTSDPSAVLVLLANDLILIDLTSSGYPSFDSPYPASQLNESPITCVQYLADCSNDLIPFLYSTSQNVVSRAPKKGFSDKEWPINGGEWGQPLQSYPELVLTGHADGTIKFWDMSGVNFDLISKIKTSKLFERPNRLPNSYILKQSSNGGQRRPTSVPMAAAAASAAAAAKLTCTGQQQQQLNAAASSELAAELASPEYLPTTTGDNQQQQQPNANLLDLSEENFFAIERIEYCAASRHLLVAGAFAQVIQFKLNKKQAESSASASSELTTILVDPIQANANLSSSNANEAPPHQLAFGASANSGPGNKSNNNNNTLKQRQHLLLKARNSSTLGGSSSGGSSSSTSSHRQRSSGFKPELICLTPMLVSNVMPTQQVGESGMLTSGANSMPATSGESAAGGAAKSILPVYYCQAPPKVTSLAFQASHSILAYAHEAGIVLVDIVQKCVIMNASLADLYGGASITANNRDIAATLIQPFATSSILQHHYQSTAGNHSALVIGDAAADIGASYNNSAANNAATNTNCSSVSAATASDNNAAANDNENADKGVSGNAMLSQAAHKLAGSPNGPAAHNPSASQSSSSSSSSSIKQQQQQQSRFTTNSMFQRQLSTTALGSSAASSSNLLANRPAAPVTGPRLFQRQMTASQLLGAGAGGGGGANSSLSPDGLTNKQRAAALLASARGEPLGGGCSPAGSITSLATGRPIAQQPPAEGGQLQASAKKPAKNKRIISRMLSISAIHTSPAADLSSSPSSASNQSSAIASAAAHTSAALEQHQYHHHHHHHHHNSATNSSSTMTGSGNDQASDKIDSSFTRSRSSSSSSTTPTQVEQATNSVSGESIHCLCFLDWSRCSNSGQANNKSLGSIGESSNCGQLLALYLGTSTGCVMLVSLAMPDSEDNRILQLQSVVAEPIPQATIKMPGAILCLKTFSADSSPTTSMSTSSATSGGLASQTSSSLEGELGSSGSGSQSPSGARAICAQTRTFLAVVSEKQAKVFQVTGANSKSNQEQQQQPHKQSFGPSSVESAADPSLAALLTNKANCVSKCQLSDSSFAARSGLVQWRQPDESCLISYLATGNLLVHSLPSLKLLLDTDFVPYSSARIGSTMCLSRNGHCLYQPSASEICKFSLSAQYKSLVNEMTSSLYTIREMPEMPRANFFKSLFSAASSVAGKQSDRDELFGECSAGKPSRGVAKHIGGQVGAAGGQSSSLDKLKGAAVGTMGHDLRMAREGLDERGEKLSEIEDRTLAMLNQSETYASAAHQLAQKFKDKKWYQF